MSRRQESHPQQGFEPAQGVCQTLALPFEQRRHKVFIVQVSPFFGFVKPLLAILATLFLFISYLCRSCLNTLRAHVQCQWAKRLKWQILMVSEPEKPLRKSSENVQWLRNTAQPSACKAYLKAAAQLPSESLPPPFQFC